MEPTFKSSHPEVFSKMMLKKFVEVTRQKQIYYTEALAEVFSCEFCEMFQIFQIFLWSPWLPLYFLGYFFQCIFGCLLLVFRSRFCTKKTNKIICWTSFVENQNPFGLILLYDYILFHTTSVLETFLYYDRTTIIDRS